VVLIGAELNAEIEHQTDGHLVPRGSKPVLVSQPPEDESEAEQPAERIERRRTLGGLAFALPAALVLGWFVHRSQQREAERP
jgi:hypothetical protein